MKIRFLTVMVAISSIFGVQQAIAKSSSTIELAKKHNKKKPKKQIEAAFSHNDGRLGV